MEEITMPQPNWWFDEDFEYYYGAMFECGDFERLCDKINAILSEHSKRIIEELEEVTKYERHECFCSGCSWKDGWNAALDEAIKKVSELN
jgi:predicted transcriptional regulator